MIPTSKILTSSLSRRAGGALAALVTVAGTLGLSVAGHIPAAHASVQPLQIVSVGDSFASGEGAIGPGWLLPSDPSVEWGNPPCHRSVLAAAYQAAEALGQTRPVNFTFLACSGSVIEYPSGDHNPNDDPAHELLGTSGQLFRMPPGRIDALTMSIGGNDVHFADILQACLNESACNLDPNVVDPLIGVGGYLQTLQQRFTDLVSQVNEWSNVRNVFLTEYPDPTTGPDGQRCGTAADPAFEGFDGLSADEATWASQNVIAPLNAAVRAAVNEGNAATGSHAVWHYVSGISSAFYTHGYCSGGGSPNLGNWLTPRYVNTPIDSITSQIDTNGSMHPNNQGQQVIAGILVQNMNFLTGPMAVSVSSSLTPVVGSPANLTVRAVAGSTPIVGGQVLIDGSPVGQTGQTGTLNVPAYAFSSYGVHTVTVQSDPYPDASASIKVQGLAYQATSSPSPIPVGSAIPQLTLTAADSATGQLVDGTFTITGGNGTVTVRSGAAVTNVTLTKKTVTSTEVGPLGKPLRITVTTCPIVSFQPDRSVFAPATFPQLLACSDA